MRWCKESTPTCGRHTSHTPDCQWLMTTDAFENGFPLSTPTVMNRRELLKHWRSHPKMQLGRSLPDKPLSPPTVITKANMTRQNSRPPKKKHSRQPKASTARTAIKTSFTATIVTGFTPSLPLKASMQNKHHESAQSSSNTRPKPGSMFSTGRCDIHNPDGRDTYTVRINNVVAAQSILKLPTGTRIQLTDATFINSYGSKHYKEISARSFQVLTNEANDKEALIGSEKHTSDTTKRKLVIYPTEFGIKIKNGVTLHRPMLTMYV